MARASLMSVAAALSVVALSATAMTPTSTSVPSVQSSTDPKALGGMWVAGMMGGAPGTGVGSGNGRASVGGGPPNGIAPGAGSSGPPPGGAGPGGPPPGTVLLSVNARSGGPGGPGGPGRGPGGARGGRVAPVIKPGFLTQIPQGTLAPNQAVLRNDDAVMLCVPDGYFGSGGGYPNLIIQTAGQITLINEENHRHRRIYLDREHPRNAAPSYAGHSVGRWEGDTLVVHTTALRERDGLKNPPDYSITERFHKINDGKQLEYSATFNSSAYATPGISSSTWTYRPELRLQEEVCEEFSDNFGADYFKK
jgi:hypothetical protein